MSTRLPPPIPLPGGDACFRCGAPVSQQADLCPHCGARLRMEATSDASGAKGCGTVVLCFVAVGFGLLGTCAGFFSYSVGTSKSTDILSPSQWPWFAVMALTWFVVAGLFLWGAVKTKRKR